MTTFTGTDSRVADRISRLQAIAKIDPQAGHDAAWAWIERLGAGLPATPRKSNWLSYSRRAHPRRLTGRPRGCWSAGQPLIPTSTNPGGYCTRLRAP